MGIAHLTAGVEDEQRVAVERDAPVGELADTDLGTLEVGQDSNRATNQGGSIANRVGAGNVVFGLAMGEVHAHDIDAGVDHAF